MRMVQIKSDLPCFLDDPNTIPSGDEPAYPTEWDLVASGEVVTPWAPVSDLAEALAARVTTLEQADAAIAQGVQGLWREMQGQIHASRHGWEQLQLYDCVLRMLANKDEVITSLRRDEETGDLVCDGDEDDEPF